MQIQEQLKQASSMTQTDIDTKAGANVSTVRHFFSTLFDDAGWSFVAMFFSIATPLLVFVVLAQRSGHLVLGASGMPILIIFNAMLLQFLFQKKTFVYHLIMLIRK